MESDQTSRRTSANSRKSSLPRIPAYRSGLSRVIGPRSTKTNSVKGGIVGIALGFLLGQPLTLDTVLDSLSTLRSTGKATPSPCVTPPASTSNT